MVRYALLLTVLVGTILWSNAVKPSLRLNTNKGSCDCVGWRDAFTKFGANCSGIGSYICDSFIMKLPNELFCINEAPGEWPNQWCYVSGECTTGNAPHLGGTAKWKYCEGDEAKLRDKKFMELFNWTVEHDLDVGIVAPWAYATWPTQTMEQVIGDFYGLQSVIGSPPLTYGSRFWVDEPNLLTPLTKIPLYEIVQENTTIFYNSKTGHQPYAVGEGIELYWINFGSRLVDVLSRGEDFFSHPGKINDVACVVGCNTTSPAWWMPLNS